MGPSRTPGPAHSELDSESHHADLDPQRLAAGKASRGSIGQLRRSNRDIVRSTGNPCLLSTPDLACRHPPISRDSARLHAAAAPRVQEKKGKKMYRAYNRMLSCPCFSLLRFTPDSPYAMNIFSPRLPSWDVLSIAEDKLPSRDMFSMIM